MWALIVKFQSEPDVEILDRLLEYMIRLRRELRYGPDHGMPYSTAACLLNLTGPAQPNELDMALPCADEVRLRFRPGVRTMRDEDAAAKLQDIEAETFGRCILPWIPLMHGGGDLDTIEQWKRITELEPDIRRRSVYASLALVFADLADRKTELQRALVGWNMRESSVINEWKAEARVEGLLQGQRKALLSVLQARFSMGVPNDLAAAIQRCNDSEELNRWLKIAAVAPSLDAFRAAISSNGVVAHP
jgi:hypothetical protein